MCGADTWQSLAEILAGMGLAVSPTREAHGPTATALAGHPIAGRAHTTLAGATGVVIEMRTRKEPGTEAPGQVVYRVDECQRRGAPMTLMLEAPARLLAVRLKL